MAGATQWGEKAPSLKNARRMRAHRMPDFPRPHPDGDIQIDAAKRSNLDPRNPRLQAANDECKKTSDRDPDAATSTAAIARRTPPRGRVSPASSVTPATTAPAARATARSPDTSASSPCHPPAQISVRHRTHG
jgi:hypothetical protein